MVSQMEGQGNRNMCRAHSLQIPLDQVIVLSLCHQLFLFFSFNSILFLHFILFILKSAFTTVQKLLIAKFPN